MSDNYAFFGPLNSYVPQVQANLLIEFAKNPNRFKYQRYADLRPVTTMLGYYRQLKNQMVIRVVDQDRRSWQDGAENPAYNKDNSELFEFKSYECQRYSSHDIIGYLTQEQAKSAGGYDLLSDTSFRLASQSALARTLRIGSVLTTGGNWGSFTDTCTAVAGGQFTAATTTNPYIRIAFTDTVVSIIKNTNGAVMQDQIKAVMNPNTAKAMFNSQEMVNATIQQPSIIDVVESKGRWNAEYWLPKYVYGVEVVIEDAVYTATEQLVAPSVGFVIPDGDVIFMTASPIQANAGGSFSTLTLFTYSDFEISTYDDVPSKRHIVNVCDNTAEVLTAPQSGYLLTAAI
jgi:hypothetical protein